MLADSEFLVSLAFLNKTGLKKKNTMTPKWLKSFIAEGRHKEEFLIND